MTMNNIQIEYPSKCWTCKLARRVWSDSNEAKGWCGCTYLVDKWKIDKPIDEREYHDISTFAEFEASGIGWITNAASPLSDDAANGYTNNQLVTRGVSTCLIYIPLTTPTINEKLMEFVNKNYKLTEDEFINHESISLIHEIYQAYLKTI